MAPDYYAEIRDIVAALTSEGLISEARDLQEVVAAGSTATEILMGARWTLKKIVAQKKVKNKATTVRITTLIAQLKKVLS